MLEIKDLNVEVGDFKLRNISLAIKSSEYVVLLGPTGVGKTVLIETIAGVHYPRNGKILMDGTDVSRFPPERRRIGYVPQDYALFPNMNVEDNIGFALRLSVSKKSSVKEQVNRHAAVFGIEHLLHRIPRALSGGEKQRVALARALAVKPDILLLDEPLAALDNVSRTSLSIELKRVQKQFNLTILHVTHDLEEAFTLSDRVAVIMDNTLIQYGPTREVFYQPKNRKVAEFVGVKNIFPAEIVDSSPQEKETLVTVQGMEIRTSLFPYRKGLKVLLCIRPQEIMLIKPDRPLRRNVKENTFNGFILDMIERNSSTLLIFSMKDESLRFYVEIPNHIRESWGLASGKELTVSLKKSALWLTEMSREDFNELLSDDTSQAARRP
jgi:ABC-type Fe3+/spermidine/putrescine transport system ATPase subunit